MKHIIQKWSIEELDKYRTCIDPRPQYQRTPVWTRERKAFLIDSILRGYDIPKIYLKLLGKVRGNDSFEVVDGQQRLRAIWEYKDNDYSLGKNVVIGNDDLSNMLYKELPKNIQKAFLNYIVVVTEILKSDAGEVNELFTRLQKGVSLNPPELRHALESSIGNYISDFAEKQKLKFFGKDCKIEDKRFKHQDYIDHVVALIYFKNAKDLKAATLYQLYLDFMEAPISKFKNYFDDTTIVLKTMQDINLTQKGIFKNKWGFVDGFWLLYRNKSKLRKVDIKEFGEKLNRFEIERKKFNEKPENLLVEKTASEFGKDMFDYIQAFNKEGANKKNIETRARVYDKVFKNLLK